MSTMQVRVVGIALLFVVILLSGFWVSGAGRPYKTLPFTVHKLAGLAVGILLAVLVYRTHQASALGSIEIAAIVVTVLFFAGTVVAGALLSIDEAMPGIVLRLHQIIPVLAVLSTVGTLYLLLRIK